MVRFFATLFALIPNIINNFDFELRQSCRDSIDRKLGSINSIQPNLRSSNRGAFTRSKSKLFMIFGISVLTLAGCQKTGQETSALQEQQVRTKPRVAVVEVRDTTQAHYTWNLSEEFSTAISSALEREHLLRLEDAAQLHMRTKKIKEDPFGKDTSWIKAAFPEEHFVVFLELAEHEERFRKTAKEEEELRESAADLCMRMHIRVFDLRSREPKVVLQDIVEQRHFVPRQFTQINFHQVPWGDANYHFSPLGIAHVQFVQEISTRIQDYILLALHRAT